MSTIMQYINQEIKRDPGICILTYPYSFAWKETSEVEIKEVWAQLDSYDEVVAYVHIPFCSRECFFCGFHKFVGKDYTTIKTYLEDLYAEIEIASLLLKKQSPLAISVGGGSPSLLKANDIARLLRNLDKFVGIEKSCEVTIEVYPDKNATLEKLSAMSASGANKISLGFQSLDNKLKNICNRHDTVNDNFISYENARKAGFNDISIDLLCGLPQQTMEMWQDSVKQTVELDPEQICFFPLSIRHPGIPFYDKVKHTLPAFEVLKKMYFWARENLIRAGYTQVTRHNFKKEHSHGLYEYHQSLGTPCLGLGVNSISFLPGYTYKNVKGLEEYSNRVHKKQLPVDTGFDLVENAEDANAFVVKRLTYLSVDKNEFNFRFQKDFDTIYKRQIDALSQFGLTNNNNSHFTLTEEGTYYTALVKRCFFSEKLHRLQTERLGRLKPPIRNDN